MNLLERFNEWREEGTKAHMSVFVFVLNGVKFNDNVMILLKIYSQHWRTCWIQISKVVYKYQ